MRGGARDTSHAHILRSVIFCGALLIMLIVAQRVMHGYGGGQTWWSTYLEEPENSLDVLFLGSSHAHYATSPMDLWREFGITSFNLTGSSQDLETSYYFLREAFQTQEPEVVVLELYMIKGIQMNDTALSSNYRLMPWGENKIKGYLSASGSYSAFQYLLVPLLRDHNRWPFMELEDYKQLVRPNPPPPGKGHPVSFLSVDATTRVDEATVTPTALSESIRVLEDIAILCANSDVKLLLYFVPDSLPEQDAVLDEVENRVSEVSDSIEYIDMNQHANEMGIDWKQDFILADGHLNHRGTLKTTRFLGEYLAETYLLRDKRDDPQFQEWDVSLQEYDSYVDQVRSDFLSEE
ncbi:MAG: hypothetical protein PF636_04900 [Actinomycetota bacterium]|jgi:hypothetical protein|nr:hypothetical protein [Actinomycetota bacterium]